MKMGITYRLFLLILCATGLAILFLILIMWWNIDRGFSRYLGNLEEKKMAQIADDLGKKYEQNRNWDFLKTKPPHWNPDDSMPPPEPPMDLPPLFAQDRHFDNPPMGPRFGNPSPNPFVILNADKESIYGFYPPDEKIIMHPITSRGNTVGYVGMMSPKRFRHPIHLNFLSQQKLALVLGAIGVVMIVIIISFPLARRLVKPIQAIAAATHDIASGKYATRVSFSSTDELGQLARDFNAMALTLEKHEKERRQWVADISHELRTPVAVLQGEIEALLDGIHQTTPETIRSLHAETLRLKRLVEDLYQISLSDLGTLTYHKENLDLVKTLKDSIQSYRAEFDRKGIALKENIPASMKAVGFADRERLKQLYTNLLENSLRYTDAGGTLDIVATINDDFFTVDFQDSKPGVAMEDIERLFERFYRVEGSRSRSSGGAGLGLTITKKIVDAHDGMISAHPSPLGGLLIRIKLPVFEGRR
jgi:two-component system, OmpR family, sensor histidine kinase BaeS